MHARIDYKKLGCSGAREQKIASSDEVLLHPEGDIDAETQDLDTENTSVLENWEHHKVLLDESTFQEEQNRL